VSRADKATLKFQVSKERALRQKPRSDLQQLLLKWPKIRGHNFTENSKPFPKMSFSVVSRKGKLMIAILAFGGIILVVSAGLFGAYALGFYDGVKDGERLAAADRVQ
jgi:hypothetical protein